MHTNSILSRFSLLICLIALSGCSHLRPKVPALPLDTTNTDAVSTVPVEGEKLVAIDLVGALVQLNEISPQHTPLNITEASSAFDLLVKQELLSAGYQHKNNNAAGQALSILTIVNQSNQSLSQVSDGLARTYEINIGSVKIKRDYLFENGRVEPNSHMYLKGADSSKIRLNDRIFNDSGTDDTLAIGESIAAISVDKATASRTQLSDAIPVSQSEPTKIASSALAQTKAPLLLRAQTESGPDLLVGDLIQISVAPGEDAQVHCYYQDGTGIVARLFPNRYTENSMVRAGETLVLPTSDQWQLTATRSGEAEKFMCFAVAAEYSERLSHMSSMPDLQPLPETDLLQIYEQYKQVVGAYLINQSISVAVN